MTTPTESQPHWYSMPVDEVAEQLQVDPAKGLRGAEAQQRLAQYGPNELAAKKKESGLAGFPASIQRFYADHPAGRCRAQPGLHAANGVRPLSSCC